MRRIGIPIPSRFLFQGILLGLNVQPIFKFLRVTLLLDMVLNISASHPLLIRSLMDLFLGAKCSIKNSSNFCDNFSNKLHCTSVRCWHWFSINLFKPDFSYLSSKIACNLLVEVQTFSIRLFLLCKQS